MFIKRFFCNHSGFTMSELVISAGLISTIVFFTGQYLVMTVKVNRTFMDKSSRDDFVNSLQANSARKTTLSNSLNRPGNDLFTKCALGGGCTSFSSTEFYPV